MREEFVFCENCKRVFMVDIDSYISECPLCDEPNKIHKIPECVADELVRRDEIIRRLKEDADRLAAQLEDPLFCEASNDLVLCEHYDLMKEQEADDD